MKKIVLPTFLVLIVFLSSCSIEPVEETFDFLEGTYRLTEYSVNVPIDLDNDTNYNTNLLEEIDCENNETLVFDRQGFMYSNLTFNPKIEVALIDAQPGTFAVDVDCDTEGVIGMAISYRKSGNTIIINERIATLNGNNITMIFKNAIDIYNQDKTVVVDTKDLKLVYSKI